MQSSRQMEEREAVLAYVTLNLQYPQFFVFPFIDRKAFKNAFLKNERSFSAIAEEFNQVFLRIAHRELREGLLVPQIKLNPAELLYKKKTQIKTKGKSKQELDVKEIVEKRARELQLEYKQAMVGDREKAGGLLKGNIEPLANLFEKYKEFKDFAVFVSQNQLLETSVNNWLTSLKPGDIEALTSKWKLIPGNVNTNKFLTNARANHINSQILTNSTYLTNPFRNNPLLSDADKKDFSRKLLPEVERVLQRHQFQSPDAVKQMVNQIIKDAAEIKLLEIENKKFLDQYMNAKFILSPFESEGMKDQFPPGMSEDTYCNAVLYRLRKSKLNNDQDALLCDIFTVIYHEAFMNSQNYLKAPKENKKLIRDLFETNYLNDVALNRNVSIETIELYISFVKGALERISRLDYNMPYQLLEKAINDAIIEAIPIKSEDRARDKIYNDLRIMLFENNKYQPLQNDFETLSKDTALWDLFLEKKSLTGNANDKVDEDELISQTVAAYLDDQLEKKLMDARIAEAFRTNGHGFYDNLKNLKSQMKKTTPVKPTTEQNQDKKYHKKT